MALAVFMKDVPLLLEVAPLRVPLCWSHAVSFTHKQSQSQQIETTALQIRQKNITFHHYLKYPTLFLMNVTTMRISLKLNRC